MGSSFLVHLVHLVHLVCLVDLVPTAYCLLPSGYLVNLVRYGNNFQTRISITLSSESIKQQINIFPSLITVELIKMIYFIFIIDK